MCKQNKAKEFLSQIKKWDVMIDNKLKEVEQWKAIATRTTAQMGSERVQSSGSQQKMADAVGTYIDIQKEILKNVDRLRKSRKEVIDVIERLNATEYDVLHKRYVQGFTYKEIGTSCGKTEGWATTIHGRALQNVEKILIQENL